MSTFYQGDTIWLRATFKNRQGLPYDPTSVEARIYDSYKTQIGAAITGTDITRVSQGVYETPYTLPLDHNAVIYEFQGIDSEGLPQVSRSVIAPIFATR